MATTDMASAISRGIAVTVGRVLLAALPSLYRVDTISVSNLRHIETWGTEGEVN